tara:strand:+ start:13210 stop:13470 length:261 start_codon:yes stop_codon:yes gene_type:complete
MSRMTIILPYQIQNVKNLVRDAFDCDEFDGRCGYISAKESGLSRSLFWDIVHHLQDLGELGIDTNCIEDDYDDLSIWVYAMSEVIE